VVGVGIDVSDRLRAEAEAREMQRRFEIVVQHLREGLVIATPDLSLLYWNPAALRLIGFDDVEEGRRLQAHFAEAFEISTLDGERLPPDRWPLARVRRGEPLMGLELVVRRKDTGRERILSYAGLRVSYGDGRQLAFMTLQDVTDRINSERALLDAKADLEVRVEERTAELQAALVRAESADRIKSAFLATMSHELWTPLNSIIGFTGIVLQGLAGPLNAEQSKQLGMVKGSAHHLLDLINDVLDISKIEAGQMLMRIEPVDVRVAVEGAASGVRQMAEQKGLALEVALPEHLPVMQTDRRRVHQVLLNLPNNAVKFTERGRVSLVVDAGASVTLDGGRPAIRFAVTDSGIGIKPADLATLFQPFRQVDSGLARHHEGTGLGLAISRRLVELLGGTLGAESTPGVGSQFTVTLPIESRDPS
jgi:PAS domain S-box-containing protein